MKKIIMLMGIVGFFAACDMPNEDKFEASPESGWVEFESIFTQASTGTTISIPVFQRSETNEMETVITYTVTKAENSPEDPPAEVLGTFESIVPADELEGVLVLEFPEGNQNYNLDVTLEGTNQNSLIVGLEGDPGEHPIVHNVQVCDGTIATSYAGESFYNNASTTTFTATFAPVPDQGRVYTIDTAWGTDFVAILAGDPNLIGQFDYSGTLTVNDDNTVVIVADDQANFPEGGTGTYNPCTKTFNLELTQAVFTTDFVVDVVLTEN